MAYLKKDEIIFAQKPRPDYSGIPEKEVKYTTSTQHVFRGQTPHNKMVYDLQNAAEARNSEVIEQMEAEAKKEGKTIIWYCCEFARGILEGAIVRGIRPDDFGSVFVESFVGKENYSELKRNLRIKEPANHQYSGYNCKGNSLYINVPIADNEPTYEEKLKSGVKYHLKRLENKSISLYYLESLMNDIQNSKEIPAFGGRDKFYREIQPFNLWLEKQADKIRAKLAQGKQKYQLTPTEIEDLEKKGFSREEINHAERIEHSLDTWLDPNHTRGPFILDDWGVEPEIKNGKLLLQILPEIERQKINQRRLEILEGFVEAFTETLIGYFESRHSQSEEDKILVEKELKVIDNLVLKGEQRQEYNAFSDNLRLLFRNDGSGHKGSIFDWYNEICIDPKVAKKNWVSAIHAKMTAAQLGLHDNLYYVVGAFALKRFKEYLKAKLGAFDLPAPNAEAPPLVTFNSLFINPDAVEKALTAAKNVKMIRRNGEVIVWSKKWQVGAIVLFWEHLQTMNPPMVHFLIDSRLAIDAIAEKFGVTVSDRTKRGTPNYKGDFLKALKVVLG